MYPPIQPTAVHSGLTQSERLHVCDCTHGVVFALHADEEEELGDEETEAQVLVDGGAVTLETPQAAERGNTQRQANQRNDHTHPGDYKEDQALNSARILRERQRQRERERERGEKGRETNTLAGKPLLFTLCVNFLMNGPKETAQNDVWFH